MHHYQQQFIEFCLSCGIIQLGEFTLKSGRKSPYFFNAGLFNTGHKLKQLSEFYAAALFTSKIDFDMMFGPAYKGIPLVVSTAMTVSEKTNQPIPFCFNRKIGKNHGEGGTLIGSPLNGRVLIIDDVITAGTAIHESMQWIQQHHAKLSGVMLALNRQEKDNKGKSAIRSIEDQYGAQVNSIIKLTDLMEYIRMERQYTPFYDKIEQYHTEYGI
jgi:orotate phosphoribosyltransferase